MKKLAIAAAVAAAALSLQSNAAQYNVSSNITGTQLFLSFQDAMTGANASFDLAIGGTMDIDLDGMGGYTVNSSNLTYTGNQVFNAGPNVRLTYDLGSGSYQNGVGVTFTSGSIVIENDTGAGWEYYNTVDVAVNNIKFTNDGNGHLGAGAGNQGRAGLILENGTLNGDGSIDIALPGLWDGQFFGVGFNSAASAVTLFGNSAGVWLEGTVNASAVPVPAAAWLFGSALMGLAGVARRRKAA